MAREVSRNTVSGPRGSVFVIGRADQLSATYTVVNGGRTIGTFEDVGGATAFAVGFVGTKPKPAPVVEPTPEPAPESKAAGAGRAKINAKVEKK